VLDESATESALAAPIRAEQDYEYASWPYPAADTTQALANGDTDLTEWPSEQGIAAQAVP
jgi:hypothetical protein